MIEIHSLKVQNSIDIDAMKIFYGNKAFPAEIIGTVCTLNTLIFFVVINDCIDMTA